MTICDSLSIVNEDLLPQQPEWLWEKNINKEFSTQRRGGQGVIAIKTSDRNGLTIGAIQVSDDDEIMLIALMEF